MSKKPIFVATHPRACSTAFERAFMTRRNDLTCIHEPFGDAFYYGPERLGFRFENDEKARIDSGFKDSTYQTILERFAKEDAEGKRLWIKDMAYYLFPPNEKPASIAPSLPRLKRGVGTPGSSSTGTDSAQTAPYPYHTEPEPGNPTVLPDQVLREFHFTFLIRHPRSSIPSYYRCTVPPLDEVTGWYEFLPLEAGYRELRRLFDYLQSTSQIGPTVSGRHDASQLPNGLRGIGDGEGDRDIVEICVVDADDLLDNPSGILEAFCKSVGLEYDSKMLDWSTEEDHQQAKAAFEKWKGWHDDALESSSLKPRAHVSRVPDLRISLFECADCLIDKKKKIKSVEEEDHEWTLKFGEKGAKVIRETVNANIGDYEYLKQFAVKA